MQGRQSHIKNIKILDYELHDEKLSIWKTSVSLIYFQIYELLTVIGCFSISTFIDSSLDCMDGFVYLVY